MAGRNTGVVPRLTRPWSVELGHDLEEYLRRVSLSLAILNQTPLVPTQVQAGVAASTGPVVGHAPALDKHVHSVQTAAPSHPTGPSASEGSGTALMRADAIIQQGIVASKGDLLGFSTVPAPVPVGANGFVLEADSTQALGLKWADPATIFSADDAEFLAWIM